MRSRNNHPYRWFTSLVLSYVLLVVFLPLQPAVSADRERKGTSKLSGSRPIPPRQQKSARYRGGELLIRFRAGLSEHNKALVIASQGGRRKKQLHGESGIEKLELGPDHNPELAAQHLRLNPAIEFAEPNFLIEQDELRPESKIPSFTGQPKRLFESPGFSPIPSLNNFGMPQPLPAQGGQPNDPRFAEQWALSNTGQNGGQFGSDINVTNAWHKTTGSAFTVIAVIDSGIDFTHPDLANNQWTNPRPFNGDLNGWDYITDFGAIRDEQGHGTAIAGIIAAEGNNNEGVSGVMWRASLMSLRVLDNTGTGDVADAIEAIDYAVAHDAQVINISWGTGGESLALKEAIERATRRGVVVVCSAGNTGQNLDQNPYYPASFNIRNLIAVASSDAFDQLPAWSNWGRRQVTVAAPGVNILTTRMGGGYWTVSGTSASAPLVSGIAGLIKTLRPRFNASNVKKAISEGGRRVASLWGKVSSGAVANAFGALDEVRGIPNPILPHTPPGYGSGGRGPGGTFSETPPPPTSGAPESNLPNLDELRNARPQQPAPRQPIHSNLMCADCDPQSGGGGSGNYPSGDPNFSTARNKLHNETGEEGVDLGSRNFNWALPIVSLPGRAGLDLNLGLAYNSLVWTKDGSFIKFNADLGTPAPGFRLGLPTLQQKFYNSQTGSYSYLMNTPSGGRVEMRQVSTGVYESADGTYTQLTEGLAQPIDLNFPAANNYYYIAARHSGKVAAVSGGSSSNGAHVVQWDWADGAQHEQFQLVPTDSGYYKVVARHSGKVWAVEGQWTTNGAKVMQWDWGAPGLHEQWKPIPTDSGYYKLEARHSGKVAAVEGQWTTNGAKVLQWDWGPPGLHEQWRFIPADQVTVRTSDGTQYTFTRVAVNNEYRCTKIKDRNGNYITATYNATNGHLLTITDTLGRVVTFIYDGNNNLQYIRQTWAGVDHNWATFEYGEVPVQPNFGGGLLVNGPSNNLVTVLTRVTLHNGSYFNFNYNAAFGQVNKINHFAADGHLLAYMFYNVDSSAGQTDCPRFTERRDWAQYWNGDVDGVPTAVEEAVTTYAVAADNSWSKMTLPDGVVHKEFFATTGWRTGLTTSTKTYANATDESADVWKKRGTNSWTQDDENLPFPKNPRVFDAKLENPEGNQRRMAITYTSFSLPSEVKEYAADGTTILRRTTTAYELSSTYTDRRIIGLVSEINVIDPSPTTLSKTTFEYDWTGEYLVATPQAATQHDGTNYGTGFVTGRGNIAAVKRWDITDLSNPAKAIAQTRTGYNTTGSAIFTRDALAHQTTISYADSFSDGNNGRNTFAYPTTITVNDPTAFSSTLQYNFDFGAVTRTQDPKGAVHTMDYDASGRIKKVTNLVNNAFTEWIYLLTMIEVNQKTTIAPGSIADETQRAFSTKLLDGAGRVRYSASDLPPTAGRYSAQRFIYDNMGRVVQQSNPTETDANWNPTGDDSAWFFTVQTYDWKGRPRVTTSPDGNTRENTYGGCGCAGGDVTTVRDERGRRRKLTMDVLGRLKQVEELNWNQTVYSTTAYTYNVRDQITNINHAGQTRSFAYDPYGRVQSRTTPEQGTTSYSYFADDTVQTVTDARGATSTFAYNNRHLITGITYGVSGGVAATPNVTFGYDEAGNRTSMTDGLGSVSYVYNTFSRLTSDTRTFTGVGTFTLTYDYNLVGELTSITNPWNAQVGYNYDKIGRPTSVSGTGFAGVTSYVNSISYRAFGLKQMAYANGRTLSLQYDNRLRLTRWDVPGVMGWEYAYHYFGEHSQRVTYAKNLYNPTLDRSYDYDHVGRVTIAFSGEDARAHVGIPGAQWGIQDGPYAHPNFYDVWGNITGRQGWGGANAWFEASYTNNKRNGFSYDAAGNLTNDGGQTFTYDATGQQATASFTGFSLQQSYDGDMLRVKKVENGTTTYYLRSSEFGGQVVAEINASGTWTRGYVYLGGQMIAIQHAGAVSWVFQDPIAKSQRVTNGSGSVTALIELDPFGGEIGSWAGGSTFNMQQQPHRYTSYERDGNASDEAMFRRYNRWHARFDQPDPYLGSYDKTNPQSLNRYTYVQNDPVNLTDPSGLQTCGAEFSFIDCGGGGGFWGGPGGFGGHIGAYNREYGGLPPRIAEAMADHDQRLQNTLDAIAASKALQRALETDDPADWDKLADLLALNPTLVITVTQQNPLGMIFSFLPMQGSGQSHAPAVGPVGGLIIRIIAAIGSRILARRAATAAISIAFGHGARHLAGTGLSQRAVEMAIRTQIQQTLARASVSGNFWGRVVVDGKTIEYRAFTLPNGTINVGTYYPIP